MLIFFHYLDIIFFLYFNFFYPSNDKSGKKPVSRYKRKRAEIRNMKIQPFMVEDSRRLEVPV